jgi:hypothetical protein
MISTAFPATAAFTPKTTPSSTIRSRMRAFSSTSIRSLSFTRLIRVRATSAPVWSPCACTIRRLECAASRPSLKFPPGSRSKRAPAVASSRTRAGPSSTRTSTAFASQSAAPAASVSFRCSSGESPAPSAAAIPPWAYAVALSKSDRLVSTITSLSAEARHAV